MSEKSNHLRKRERKEEKNYPVFNGHYVSPECEIPTVWHTHFAETNSFLVQTLSELTTGKIRKQLHPYSYLEHKKSDEKDPCIKCWTVFCS